MEITVNADEAYYLTCALSHAIRRVEKHAKKVRKVPDGGGAYSLSMRDVQWLQALLDEVDRQTPPLECP
jgi:hypothetical protein